MWTSLQPTNLPPGEQEKRGPEFFPAKAEAGTCSGCVFIQREGGCEKPLPAQPGRESCVKNQHLRTTAPTLMDTKQTTGKGVKATPKGLRGAD